MSELAYMDFERQVEELPLVQLYRLRDKINLLISRPRPEHKEIALSPITARMLGVAHFEGDYDNILEESIKEKWL